MYSGLLHDQRLLFYPFFLRFSLSHTHTLMQNHEKASLQATSVHESTLHDAQNSLKDGEEKVRRGKARAGVERMVSLV